MGTGGLHAVDRRRDIQGLRALAVGLVVAQHAGAGWVSGGFVGVDVFLVISRYLITLLLLREAESHGSVSISRFYARRARRILPAATVVLLATMLYAALELSVFRVQQLREDAWWAAVFGANVHFAEQGTDYFAQGSEPSPFQHFWSLAVEEQFYLVWPLLLALLVLATRTRGPGRRTLALTMALSAGVVASLAWSVLMTERSPGPAYYSSAGRAWELGVGPLLAVQQDRLLRLRRGTREGLALVGLVAVLVAATAFDGSAPFPGWRAVVPVAGAAALVMAGAGTRETGEVLGGRLLSVTPMVWLGDLSYSLYLWHWPILVLGPAHSETFSGRRGALLLLALVLVSAVASYHLVENPVRRNRYLRRGRRSLALWPLAVGGVAVAVVAAEHHATAALEERMTGSAPSSVTPTPDLSLGPESRRPGKGRTRTAPTLASRVAQALALADTGAPVPFPLTNVPRLREPVFRLDQGCIVQPEETSVEVCPIGRTEAARTMVVIGDSQAGQWMPAIDQLGKDRGLQVLPLIKLGCTPFDVPEVDGGGADYWQCTEFRAWAAAYIDRVRPDLVIVGSEATSDRMYARPGLTLQQTWTTGVESLLDRLHGAGARVVVLADTPDLTFEPLECLTDPDTVLRDCVGTPHRGLAAANAATREVASRLGAGFVDTVSMLCLRGRCPTVVDRTMTFVDYSHVSPTWSAALAADFARRYASALPRAPVRPRPDDRPNAD